MNMTPRRPQLYSKPYSKGSHEFQQRYSIHRGPWPHGSLQPIVLLEETPMYLQLTQGCLSDNIRMHSNS